MVWAWEKPNFGAFFGSVDPRLVKDFSLKKKSKKVHSKQMEPSKKGAGFKFGSSDIWLWPL